MELTVILCGIPIAIYLAVVVLRAVVHSRPSHLPAARTLSAISWSLVGADVFALVVATAFTDGPGLLLSVVLGVGLIQLVASDLRLSRARREAEQTEFLWVLSRLLQRRGNLPDDLELYAQGQSGRYRSQLMELARALRRGAPLSELAVPQGLIPDSLALELQAALPAGNLESVVTECATRMTRSLGERNADPWQSQLVYLLTVTTTSLFIVGFLSYWIVPKFKNIFQIYAIEIPPATQLLFACSDAINRHPELLVSLVVLGNVVLTTSLRGRQTRWIRNLVDWVQLKWPRRFAVPLLRCLAQGVAANRSLELSLRAILDSSSPTPVKSYAARLLHALQAGNPPWDSFATVGLLRPDEARVLAQAADAGNLAWAMETLGEEIQRRRTNSRQAWAQVLTPVATAIPLILVVLAVIAVILPLIAMIETLC